MATIPNTKARHNMASEMAGSGSLSPINAARIAASELITHKVQKAVRSNVSWNFTRLGTANGMYHGHFRF